MFKKLFTFALIIFLAGQVFGFDDIRLLHEADINGSNVVFIYAEDIWTASADGGLAKRLTTHLGMESFPKFSPDGKWIAFTGQYDGNTDIFVMPAEGGNPKRITYHPGADNLMGWTNDGKRLIFRSGRDSYSRFSKFYMIDAEGGFPEPMPVPMGDTGTLSPDGKYIAYSPINTSIRSWKRYRGGMTTPVWILDLSTLEVEEIPHQNATDFYPVWLGDTIYFLSDRERTMDIFAYNVTGKTLRKIKSHSPFDIKYLSGNKDKLIYDAEGYLYVLDTNSGRESRLNITVAGDKVNVRPHFETVSDEIVSSNISPSGVRAVFEAHGEILTVPQEKGDIRNLTNSPEANDRFPAWSPDGRYIAYFSDNGGEYALYLIDQMSKEQPDKIDLEQKCFFYNPVWSPDSRKIAYFDNHLNIWYLDIETRKPVKVDKEEYSDPDRSLTPAWSPDSKWLTYSKRMNGYFRAIFFYSLDEKMTYQITDGMSDAFSPVFDPEGSYLYFIATTNVGPTKGWLDMSSFDHTVTMNMYLAVLDKDKPSPFQPESDEEKVKETEKKPEENEKKSADEAAATETIKIDLEDIGQRILAVPGPSRFYSNLQAGTSGNIFYLESVPNAGNTLHKFDMKKRESEEFLSRVADYSISSDGKKMLYRSGLNWSIVSTTAKSGPGDGRLNLANMEIWVDPRVEWEQMLVEAWRLNRDYFYDPGMHGVDWDKMLDRYKEYLPYVAHRSDLNYLISEMIGELCVGHARVNGGDFPDVERVPGGLLGADFEVLNRRYSIKKIFSGLNWNPDLRAPLTEPGVNVSEGDYIIKVNGIDLTSSVNIYSLFEKTAGKQVVLQVNSEPSEEGSKEVTVVPVSSEYGLRNRDWVEGNRRIVDEMTGGRVGYVYLPNTSGAGYTYFNRYFFSQLEKEALVIDERFNGGGTAADYFVDLLDRPLLSYWATRDGKDFTTPFASVFGPKAMIINEYAGSGGDALPLYFKRSGIGPLVGKRTWGGLVGAYGNPPLMDGAYVNVPSLAIWSPDGEWEVENIGVYPDYEVDMIPAEVAKGNDPQLIKSVELLMEELRKNPARKINRPKYPIRK
ncbi:PDZ domain-containing protein [candidate division KSB1 bacterium]